MAVLGLRFCARAFSSCGKRGPLFIAVRGPLTIAASLVAEHRLQTRRLSNCGSWAQLLRGMWDLPRPGLEPVSPALAGRFSTTAPPGNPPWTFIEGCSLTLKTKSSFLAQFQKWKYSDQIHSLGYMLTLLKFPRRFLKTFAFLLTHLLRRKLTSWESCLSWFYTVSCHLHL